MNHQTNQVYFVPLLAAALLALGNPSAASAQTINTFDVTGATGGTFPAAINLSGTIAGSYFDAAGSHGFLRAPDGTTTTIDPPFCIAGSTGITTSDTINSAGAVVGICTLSTGTSPQRVFLRDPMGNFTEISPPNNNPHNGMGVFPSINDMGQIAGSYTDLSSHTHGFVVSPPYASGNYTIFDVPGDTYAETHIGIEPVSINSSGQVAGYYFVGSSTAYGFLRNPDNTFTTFPAPVATDRLQVTSMNDNAEITGFYTSNFSTFEGLVWQAGTTTSFNVTSTTTQPESINLSGTVVGWTGNSSELEGFVGNPLNGFTTFAVATASYTEPTGVNDLGTIEGIWLDASFARHGFIATFVTSGPPSSGTSCNGTYDGTFNGNVTVSAGQTCNFVGGGIGGNVTVNGGTLGLSDATVSGNVQIGGGTFSIGPSTVIQGNLEIGNLPAPSRQNQICGTTVLGNLQFHNNATAVAIGQGTATCPGNSISGGLQVQNNTAAATIIGNTVSGNLQCSGNTSISGSGNTVSGHKQGQCAAF